MLGDVASSLFGSMVAPSPRVDQQLQAMDGIPTWDRIRESLHEQQTPEERSFRDNLKFGYGVGSPLHKIRLYDASNKEDDIRVVFYRDSASWCPYCHKVWMALEHKKIPYRVEKVNMRCYGEKPNEFMRLQPSGQIPVAIIDGRTYGQSNDILFQLDQLFPEVPLQPKDPKIAPVAQEMLRLERRIFSTWMYWLTSSGDYKSAFVDSLQQVERALDECDGPFFLGDSLSIVDIQFAPFLERMAASMLYFKGFVMRVAPGETTDYPNLNRWFDAMETLDAYQLTKSDYYTHCWDLPPQLGGCVQAREGEPFARAINGERLVDGSRGSWELPLAPHNGGAEPDWTFAGDEAAARREAVERVSANYEAIVRFASRGAGKRGMPSYSAPLADPNATPNESVQESVGAVLRVVCASMLEGETLDSELDKIVRVIRFGGEEYVEAVVASLSYMRDRVGVPRDMKYPAARQLRAHLNWSVGKLLP